MSIRTARQARTATATANVIQLRTKSSDVSPRLHATWALDTETGRPMATWHADPRSVNRLQFTDLNAELARLDRVHSHLLGVDGIDAVVTEAADRFTSNTDRFDQAA